MGSREKNAAGFSPPHPAPPAPPSNNANGSETNPGTHNADLNISPEAAKRQRGQFQAVLDKARKEHRLSKEQGHLDFFKQPPMSNVGELLAVIGLKNQKFEAFRAKNHRIYSVMRSTLTPIEVVGGIIAGAAEEVFSPAQILFSSVMFFVTAARGVSEAYDSIISLMEQLGFFTKRLNQYIRIELEPDTVDLLGQIMAVLFEVIVISANAISKGRAKAFVQNLFGGDDAVQDAVGRLETLFGFERGQIIAEIMKNMGDLKDSVRDGFQDTHDTLEKVQMNQGRLIEDLSRLEQSLQTLRKDESLHGDKLHDILHPSVYPYDLLSRFKKTMATNTGLWVMDEAVMSSWLCSEWPFLLMYGAAGVGKSYLSTRIINDFGKLFLESGDSRTGRNSLAYFFFRNDNPETRSPLQALWDIAGQLAEDDVYYSKVLLESISSSDDIKTIASAFRKLILEPMRQDVRQRKIFLLFDGLDEAPWEEVQELLFNMKDLSNLNIQILLTARPELQDPITQVFDEGEGVGDKLHYLHVTAEKNKRDVQTFIEESITKARNIRRAPRKFQEKIIKGISKRAGGVFIMAALMVADVTNVHMKRPDTIENSLKEYPSSVTDLLRNVMQRVCKTLSADMVEDLRECLIWVSLAEETLTLGQVEAIMTLKLGCKPWGLEHDLRASYSSFFTLDRDDGWSTSDLLDRREQAHANRDASPGRSPIPDDLNFQSNPDQTDVVFFHASLGDFFRSDASTHIEVDGHQQIVGFDENTALIHIALTCLRVFAEPGFCTEDTARLQVYAARHWQRHVTRIDLKKAPADDKTQLLRLVYRMLTDEAIVFNWTDFNEYTDFIQSHKVLEGIQKLLAEVSASGLNGPGDTPAASWARSGATNLHAMIEPMGQIFSRAWLLKNSGVSRNGIHKSTIVCANFIQNVAYLKKGFTWRSEQDDPSLSLETKLNTAIEWANQKHNWWWQLRVGSTWMTRGEYAKALDHYDKARDLGGDVISTSARIAVCYQLQGKYQEALDLFLICEAKEEELMESGQVSSQIEHLNRTWRLYKDCYQAATCLMKLNRIDEAAEYYRKAIQNAYDKTLFEAETAYIALLIKHNRFKEITTILQKMDRPDSGDPSNMGTRLVHFLVQKATDSIVLEWIPRTACRKEALPFAKEQYKIARTEAKNMEDTAAEFALQLGRAVFHILARDYSHANEDLEAMCFSYYRPKGSLPIRSIQTQALKRLAYLYKQLALHTEEYESGANSGRWTGGLETLEQKLRENQSLDVPIQLVGQSHNDASMYKGLLSRKTGDLAGAREVFRPLVLEALDILEDDEPQNDTYAINNLAMVLMAAGEIDDAMALHQSMRPPDSTIIASAVSEEKEEAVAVQAGRLEPKLPGMQLGFCMQCLDTLDDRQPVAVCQYCLDPFCLKCLAHIQKMDIKKWEDIPSKRSSVVSKEEAMSSRRDTGPVILESSCRKDHEWVTVKPLGTELKSGEILVGEHVVKFKKWTADLRRKWTST
ncbi:nacht and tpr domain protein [Zalerion maritima]|uniref:Nacht and tpr domain protein n=1 Tax=Zalerion maritima TaxID=339359 RepID=A0AAD5RQH0_9PEZI|nr:nacht and tpr domain protein [Zalerion maritima]